MHAQHPCPIYAFFFLQYGSEYALELPKPCKHVIVIIIVN